MFVFFLIVILSLLSVRLPDPFVVASHFFSDLWSPSALLKLTTCLAVLSTRRCERFWLIGWSRSSCNSSFSR